MGVDAKNFGFLLEHCFFFIILTLWTIIFFQLFYEGIKI